MKNTLPFLLICFCSFTAYTQSSRSLNVFSKITFAEKDLTVTGTFNNRIPLKNAQVEVLASNMPAWTRVHNNLQVSEDKFFEELIKPYKGKVVYIDFWAPWCGPCMAEMSSSKRLQQEVTGKDIVFLYIGIGCTKQSWENTIKERGMEGEHYFANDDEGKLLSSKFNISSIPHYVLIDKEGKVRDDDAPRPSDKTKMLRKFNDLLK